MSRRAAILFVSTALVSGPAFAGGPKSSGGGGHASAPVVHAAAPAAHMSAPAASAGHFGAAPAGHMGAAAPGHYGAAAPHSAYGAGHEAARSSPYHAGAAGHPGGYGGHEAGRGFGGHEAGGREAGHEMAGREGGHDLRPGDPAARGHFDEHMHNPEREHDIARLHGHDFHVRDVRYFNEHEWGRWRGGYWNHDYYDGRFGWWFAVDGIYYPYAAPIYPYPLEVAPLVYNDVPSDPPPVGIAPLPALPHAAYHCANPSGFFPALSACETGWTVLAAH